MKFTKLKLMILAVASLSLAAFSASAAADTFASVRTVVVDAPRLIIGAASSAVTNNWTDIHGFEGIAKIDFSTKTNAGGATLSVLIQTSADQTNFTTLNNVAYATAASIIYTNNMYPAQLTATDVINFPGVITTPTASSSGWATPYIAAAPFTNTATALSLLDGVTTIGFNASDANRYVRLIYSTGGTVTNISVSATMTGLKQIVP
jgi:hypothetical protein